MILGSKENFMIALTKQGQIYIWGEFSVPTPQEDGNQQKLSDSNSKKILNLYSPQHISYFKNVKINQITCSDQVAFFLSSKTNIVFIIIDEGTLYGWGDDSEYKYGILGLGNQYKALRPCPNSQLFDYMIKNVSLTDTHGCAVDSTGRLFCWGYGPNGELGLENQVQQVSVPTIVTKQKQITIKKAVAHSTYTVFISSMLIFVQLTLGAGYVYLFGTLHQSIARMQQSSAKFGFQTNPSMKNSTQVLNFEKINKDNNLQKSSNRAINSMIQIISLSENFICDLVCGDSFIICMTQNGDVFFVDDALESVQISTSPIDNVAISGTKIVGISQNQKLYEWSTAGLNKLSFNKENKMLLRQDFQIKEYQILNDFQKEAKIFNFPLSRSTIGYYFEDQNFIVKKLKQDALKEFENDFKADNQIMIAQLIPNSTKQSHFNPLCNESSVDQSKDYGEEQLPQNEAENYASNKILTVSDDSFQNPDITPEISLAINEFTTKNDQQPSFRVTEDTQNEEQMIPSQFMNEKDIQNIFTYQKQVIQDHQNQNTQNNNFNRTSKVALNNLFQPINQGQFFLDQSNNFEPALGQNFPYRPSSIKGIKQSNDKSLFSMHNNSSPSLKQCAEQMMPLERNSKIELSYPSFLNNSSDNQFKENKDDKNPSLETFPLSPADNSSQKIPVINLQERLQQVYLEDQKQRSENQEEQEEEQEQRLEFQIKFQPCDTMNFSQSQNSNSREASIIKTTRKVDEKIEQSMEITIDNIKIRAKRTTTPKRLLNSYSQYKRLAANQDSSQNNQDPNQTGNKSINSNSMTSELSSGFNITQNSIQRNIRESKIQMQQNPQEQVNQKKIIKKLSNSCGSYKGNHKKRSFIQAVLQNQVQNQNFKIENQQTSVTQIYDTCPLKDDSKIIEKKQQERKASVNEDEQEENMDMTEINSISDQQQTDGKKLTEQNESQQIYYIYGDQSNSNIINYQVQNPIQQRFSQMVQKDGFFQRESIGPVTQTEDNFEVEYTISNSCTPDSKQSKESNIKRRINFDDAGDYSGAIIRVSDTTSNNRLITSFTLNLGNNQTRQFENNERNQIILQKVSNPQSTQNYVDQSQSFIFNQTQSPMTTVAQPFNDENMVSNIKSVSTPSHQGNTTHIMMLTEEKFKNLRTEISQQQEPQSNNFLITQNPLLSSPNLNDYGNFTKGESMKSLFIGQPSNIQNLSSFIQHSKYFQVYENFRRGFMILIKLRDQKTLNSMRQMKKVSQDKKQRVEFMQNFAKYLSNTLRHHITQQKQFGFKRLKKFYKERQLQVYIQKKQNEFAIKTSALVKIDQIIVNHLMINQQQGLKMIIEHANQLKKAKQEKQRRSMSVLYMIIYRKSKQIQEKSLRSIQNWVNEKRILEMNFRMLSRIVTKIVQKQKKLYFNKIKQSLITRDRQKQIILAIFFRQQRKAFTQFKLNVIKAIQLEQTLIGLVQVIQNINFNRRFSRCFSAWKDKVVLDKKMIIAFEMLNDINEHQTKLRYFNQFKSNIQQIYQRQQYHKTLKASFLLLFKKIDDMRKSNLRQALKLIIENQSSPSEETMMIHKSNTLTNLSFNLQPAVEMSLILNHRKKTNNNLNMTDFKELQQENTSSYNFRTHQQPPKSQGKKANLQRDKKNIQLLNQNTNDKNKRPILNDYLSFTPNSASNQKQNQSKFFNRRKTEAGSSSAKNQDKSAINFQKTDRLYLDCPLPIKDYQDKMNKRNSSNQQSFENMNQLNVSIKDMNKAFRDQINKIKEKQEDNENSYISSFQNITCQDQSFDYKINQLQIQLSQTPDQLNNQSGEKYKKKLDFDKHSKDVSPKINPLCVSESYQLHKGGMTMQTQSLQTYGEEPTNHVTQQNYQQQQRQLQNQIDYQRQIVQNFYKDYSSIKEVQLGEQIDQYGEINEHNSAPQTSTFGALRLRNDENIVDNNEDERQREVNKSQVMIAQREDEDVKMERKRSDLSQNLPYGSNISRKKSDQRYQMNSILEQDYSLEVHEKHGMFDVFDNEDKDRHLSRIQSAVDISKNNIKTCMSDLSKNIDQQSHYTQGEEISQDFIEMKNNYQMRNTQNLKGTEIPIQNAYEVFRENLGQNKQNGSKKVFHISPKFNDDSFVPSQMNRELFNEMAQNYQMLELTPEADYHMLLNNKSIFNREESIYSNNQYAEPMEMALSPRVIHDVSVINHQNITTNASQLNYYGMETQQDKQPEENDNDYGEEISQIIEEQHNGRDSRPYDFELSSHSKFKIISENMQAQNVLTSESAQPSVIISNNNTICKKLSFGYDMAKKNTNQYGNNKGKSTLLVSGGEQTINFNLTQEEDEQFEDSADELHQNSDEELEVGEEKPAEFANNINMTIPDSRILQQELQEEKFNMTLSQHDLMQITQNRLQKMQQHQYAMTQRDNMSHPSKPQFAAQDIISANVQKLRNIIKVSPRYNNILETNQSDDFQTKIMQGHQSTRNQKIQGFFQKNLTGGGPQQTSSYEMQMYQTQATRQSTNNFCSTTQEPVIFKSFVYNNNSSSVLTQNKNITNSQNTINNSKQQQQLQPKGKYLLGSSARNTSKDGGCSSNNSSGFAKMQERKQSVPTTTKQLTHQQSQSSLADKSYGNMRKSGSNSGGYQPLTFRAPAGVSGNSNMSNTSNNLNLNQYNSFGSTANTMAMKNSTGNFMFERRVSHQEPPSTTSNKNIQGFGTQSQRASQNSLTNRSRNPNGEQLQTFLSMGNRVMSSVTSSIKSSQNTSMNNNNMRHMH